MYVYILTNKDNSVLYTGVTNDLIRRVYEHKNNSVFGFTYKYNLDKLVYYEICQDPIVAIEREKQIKAGSRNNKLRLVNKFNPEFKDLYNEIL